MRKTIGIIVSMLMVLTMIPFQSFGASLPLTDRSTSEWFYSVVQKAYETALINGFEDNSLQLNENMTNEFNSLVKYTASGTVTDGGLVSSESVYESLIALKSQYPEGTYWSDDKYYIWNGYNPNEGVLWGSGYGCVAFSFMLSDAAFGNLPARFIDVNFDNVRVGDIIRNNKDTHNVIVLEIHGDYIVIAEGNYNDSVHWGRKLSKEEVNNSAYILTRYPSQSFGTEMPFLDVPASEWYYNDVKQAYESGLINGMDATTFAPNENMTYAQAVKLAACMNQKYSEGYVTLENGSPNWWDSYVDYARNKGIISKNYNWNAPATRAGYVEIFANALPSYALSVKNTVVDNAIPDIGMSHPQAAAIYKLYRAGILTGMDEIGTFAPNSNIRRSEVSAILTRMMDESARKDLTLGPVTPDIPVGYTVSFESNGGNTIENQTVKENEKAAKPSDPTREGFKFAGWYSDSALTTAYNFTSAVMGNLTLYAKWNEISSVEYTVSFESNGGSVVEKQTIKENEKAVKPKDPSRKNYSFIGWYSDSELTTTYDFNSAVTENLTLYAKWIDAGSTDTIKDSWENIIASVDNGTYKSKYKVGDTKSLDLGPEGVVEMQIAAFDADELADGSGNAAVTWISKELLKTKHRMNPELNTNIFSPSSMLGTGSVGGWEHSEMRMWLKSDIKQLIPSVVRNSIKPVIKTSNSWDTSLIFNMNETTTDDIWIPSYREVFGEEDYNETKGVIYDGLFTSDNSRQKKINGTDNVSWWLLRSASYDIESDFTIHPCYGFTFVGEDGTGYFINFAEDPEAVAIGFCM